LRGAGCGVRGAGCGVCGSGCVLRVARYGDNRSALGIRPTASGDRKVGRRVGHRADLKKESTEKDKDCGFIASLR
jgi:hypothetical protein